jgi:hypothetical protein
MKAAPGSRPSTQRSFQSSTPMAHGTAAGHHAVQVPGAAVIQAALCETGDEAKGHVLHAAILGGEVLQQPTKVAIAQDQRKRCEGATRRCSLCDVAP